MEYPKVYLTLDNCFAIKRWVEPSEWMPLIRDIGFTSAQASFDNEIDFLYSPEWYKSGWFQEVSRQEKETGLRVDTFFTGYQTYRTAGLAHPDDKMADYLMDWWIKPALNQLGRRGAHMGMSFIAVPERFLQDAVKFQRMYEKVIHRMGEIGACASKNGIHFCMEAMYAPHQPPWTIEGAKRFLRDCYAEGGHPVYLTIDVGHMVGQCKYRKPDREAVEHSLNPGSQILGRPKIWLGAEHTYKLWRKAVEEDDHSREAVEAILEDMEAYLHLFSTDPGDSDPYRWLGELACYSPIIHMQQTDGITSSHQPFTKEENEKGIIQGEEVLRAIAHSYEQEQEPQMPPKCQEIYLAFEIFAGNTEYREEIIEKLKETLNYWRRFVPEDGIRLDVLLKKLQDE